MPLPVVAASIIFLLQSIEGVVLRLGSAEPIAGVELTLDRVQAARDPDVTAPADVSSESAFFGRISPVTTDRQGRFMFKDLGAGSYRLFAAWNGYTRQEYGQRVARGQGTVISLAERQALKDVTFRLTPAGTITGHVIDDAGEPVTGLQVQILRSAYYAPGKRTFQSVGSARTDDRGEYRLYWVTPGRYHLSVGSGGREPSPVSRNELPAKPYPPTYYPGTTDLSQASVIDVQPGVELSGVDFVLARHELYQIRGRIIDATTGQPPREIQLRIFPRQRDVPFNYSESNRIYNPINGTFQLRDVAPGSYWIYATASPDLEASVVPKAGSRTFGELFMTLISSQPGTQAPVEISGRDLENLVLTLRPGLSIRGRLSLEGQDLPAITDFKNIQVTLTSVTPSTNETFPRPIAPDGTFSVDNVLPGEYRVSVHTMQPEIYVQEARLGSADVLNEPVLISGPVSGTLDIVLSTKSGQIDGTLVNEQSRPLSGVQTVLVPDRFRDRIELYKTAITDETGRFTMRGIAPGEYKIFAWDAIEEFAYFDPDFLRQLEQKGKPVSISESSKISVEAKIIPAPQ